MKITITPKNTAIPLQLELSGHSLEFSDLACGSSISIRDERGSLTVSLVEVPEVHQTVTVEEVKPEAVSAAAASETVKVIAPVALPVVEEVQPVVVEPEQLFQRLVALRKQISSEVRLPPYIIFHDSTLKEMCRLLPADLESLKVVQGVGLAKLEKYGMRFIEAIREFAATHAVKEVAQRGQLREAV